MKKKKWFDRNALFVILGFIVTGCIYFLPIFGGKTTSMHDVNQGVAAAKEIQDYFVKSREWSWWTNSIFGGMPSYLIGAKYPYSLSTLIGQYINLIFPRPLNVIFLLFIGFFIFMRSMKFSNWLSGLGSFAYAFGTYNFLFTEAGHLSKILALAYAPGILAAINFIFDKKYFTGTAALSLFLGLELYGNHLQITYYFIFIYAAYTLYKFIQQSFSNLPKIVACLLIGLLIGLGMSGMRLWTNFDYSKESTRGISELKDKKISSDGLNRDYAFGWSYGIDETLTLLVPDIMGGASSGSLTKDSQVYKALIGSGVDSYQAQDFIKHLPLYFGNQSFTAGPAYSGAIIVFLFILGLFFNRSKLKWLLAGFTAFFIVLSWGSNFPSINNFIFDNLPGYNKFRAVTMILTVVHFLLVWGAMITLDQLIDKKPAFEEIKKAMLYTGGLILALIIIVYFSLNFNALNDDAFKNNLIQGLGEPTANGILRSLILDRQDMVTSDIFRTIILILLAGGILWAYFKNKIKENILIIALSVLIIFDLFSVNKRYFNNNDLVSKSNANGEFYPSAANEQILRDQDPHFRVINLSTGFWSDARDAYFHKIVGGYHGAKLKKIQELYDNQMIKDEKLNLPIINMLNTKYVINATPDGSTSAQLNPEALGNAWFVDTLSNVADADAELKALSSFNPKSKAFVQNKFGVKPGIFPVTEQSKIKLTSYAPNQLVYSTQNPSNGFAVFSEVFYKGNVDWISYLDGQIVPHCAVNYVLRGMNIPAGTHEIKFEFKPAAVEKGKYIDLASSILFLVLIFIAIKWRD